jgi:hypothetical protein
MSVPDAARDPALIMELIEALRRSKTRFAAVSLDANLWLARIPIRPLLQDRRPAAQFSARDAWLRKVKLVPNCKSSRNHSLTVAARKSLLSRERKQPVPYANFCELVLGGGVGCFRSLGIPAHGGPRGQPHRLSVGRSAGH